MTGSIRLGTATAVVLAVMLGGTGKVSSQTAQVPDKLSVLQGRPTNAGQAMVHILREPDADLSVVGVVQTSADSERLFAWFREIEQFQRSTYVPTLGRFSAIPQIHDLAGLTLDETELQELKECRPGHCDTKLAESEIARITAAIDAAGFRWRDAAQQAFREMLLGRAQAFLARGLPGTPGYNDHREPVSLANDFGSLLAGCSLDGLRRQDVAEHVRRFPPASVSPAETILFWSRDLLGDAKPIIGITALSLFPAGGAGEPAIALALQVYASHYITSSLSVVTVIPVSDRVRYLVYRRCTRADVFGGAFGGFIRRMVNKRIRAEGPPALDGLRRKLESGPPDRATSGSAVRSK